MSNTYCIYKIQNKINRKCYIGFTENFEKRKKEHIKIASYGKRNKLYNAIRKYGEFSFSWDIIYISDDKEDTLTVMEQLFIDLYNSIECGYNQKQGGRGGSEKGRTAPPKSLIDRENIARRQLGGTLSEETKQKISKAHKGKKLKEETLAKMILSRRKERRLVDPNGVLYVFFSIKEFCENHKLSRPDISKVLRGKISQYKGWNIEYN